MFHAKGGFSGSQIRWSKPEDLLIHGDPQGIYAYCILQQKAFRHGTLLQIATEEAKPLDQSSGVQHLYIHAASSHACRCRLLKGHSCIKAAGKEYGIRHMFEQKLRTGLSHIIQNIFIPCLFCYKDGIQAPDRISHFIAGRAHPVITCKGGNDGNPVFHPEFLIYIGGKCSRFTEGAYYIYGAVLCHFLQLLYLRKPQIIRNGKDHIKVPHSHILLHMSPDLFEGQAECIFILQNICISDGHGKLHGIGVNVIVIANTDICFLIPEMYPNYILHLLSFSNMASHSFTDASLGILQSPLGDMATEPTFTPSGIQLRLNCCEKKRFVNMVCHFMITSGV